MRELDPRGDRRAAGCPTIEQCETFQGQQRFNGLNGDGFFGDTIKFVDVEHNEVAITGRTKHFLSLTGEHLSVENMNKAIELVSEELNISIPEYTVVGFPYQSFFAHKWYIASNDNCNTEVLKAKIDQHLRKLNDDYATERDSSLKEVFLEKLPEEKFMKFMELKGKLGSQHKFPRVMKGKMLEDWNRFLGNGKP